MPEFYIRPMFDRKIFSGILCVCVWAGGGQGNAPLPSPTPMAGPQAPHQLNPALVITIIIIIKVENYYQSVNVSESKSSKNRVTFYSRLHTRVFFKLALKTRF